MAAPPSSYGRTRGLCVRRTEWGFGAIHQCLDCRRRAPPANVSAADDAVEIPDGERKEADGGESVDPWNGRSDVSGVAPAVHRLPIGVALEFGEPAPEETRLVASLRVRNSLQRPGRNG